ncbi:MAG TPA: PIN domain-containing protein [Alloacidobacterium sp.]|nr:PIN domain-containing protein [Alloacidobacterium sp.]
MPAEVFFDTTILIYALKGQDERAVRAEALLADGGVVSVQVLNEFVAVARRKLRMPWEQIEEALTYLRALCGESLPITADTHESAIRIARRYGYHIYDSLMIASAREAGCTTLYSEDMQHGQRVGPLKLTNPFLI